MGTGRSGARVHAQGLIAVALGVVTVLVAGCAPPTAPGPTVVPQPPDRGRVPGVAVAASTGCSAQDPLPTGTSTLDVQVGGGARHARVYVPAAVPADVAKPVLLSLHPFSFDGASWEEYSGLAAAAVERGYVVILPTGSEPGPRWAVPGGLETGIDDLSYLGVLLDEVEDRTCVDRNRQFAAGFSAGAAMSQALSCTVPWRIAAVAGSGGTNLTDLCPDSPPTDVLTLHGTADPIAPITGSEVVFAPPLGLHVDTVVATNAARAGCDTTPVVDTSRATVVVDRYAGCDAGHRVEYWRMLGAGHTWAGSVNPFLELFTGPSNTEISANEVVLDFFDDVTVG